MLHFCLGHFYLPRFSSVSKFIKGLEGLLTNYRPACGATIVLLLTSLPSLSQSAAAPKPGGFGGFASTPTYGVPVIDSKVDSISSVAAADLNGDGKADAVIGLTDGVAILLNDGAGHLTNSSTISLVPSPTTLANSFQHVLVAVGDVNGDGKPDIAAAVSGNVWVLLNKGDGTFTAPSTPYSLGAVIFLAIGDVTGDGNPDIVVGLADAVNVMKGNGNGSFSPFMAVNNGVGTLVPILRNYNGAIGDINGDGKPDLVTTGFLPTNIGGLTLDYNTGTQGLGFWNPSSSLPTQSAPYGIFDSVVLADVNHDGLLDIVLGTSNYSFGGANDVAVALNQGGGNSSTGPKFSDPVRVALINSGGEDYVPPWPYASKPLPNFGLSIMTTDFNGDGYPDLLVNDSDNGAIISLQNNKDNTFTMVSTVPGGLGISPVAMADFNGDGKPDILVANAGTNTVSVLLGKGGGVFDSPPTFAFSPPTTTTQTANAGNVIADFNGDGTPDYVYSDASGNVYERLSSSSGYQSISTVLVASPLGGSTTGALPILAADFNGDGKQDLLLQYGGYESGTTYIPTKFGIAVGKGDGTFVVPSTLYGFSSNYSLSGYVVTDLNKDGRPDIEAFSSVCINYALNCNAGSEYWSGAFLGNGDGSFQPGVFTELDPLNMSDGVAVGDVTGDGVPDLVVSNTGEDGLLSPIASLPVI